MMDHKMPDARFAVYYDGSCPMCRREISFYQRRSGAHAIDWIDVSSPEQTLQGLSCEAAMARFHIRKLDGSLVDGGLAFAELWKRLPAFRWIGLFFSTPPMNWILNASYNAFLPLRPRLQRLLFRSEAQFDPRGVRK